MAFNVKGITIEINGDASGLEKALRSVKAETQGIDKQMSKVAKAMKSGFNSSATQAQLFINQQGLMQSKYANLSKQIGVYNQALSATKQAYQENLQAFGEYDERTMASAQNVEYLESQIAILRSEMDTLGASMLTCSTDGMLFYNTLGNIATKADQVSQALKPISMVAAGALAGAVQTTMSFEDAWTGVLKTVEGTPQQLERVNTGLKELALNTASSYETLAGYAELGGQMGVATDDIVTFTKTIAMLGDTTNVAGDEAAQALAQIANVMVDASERTSDYYERFGSTVVDLGNNFATTEADIVALTQRLATAGRQVGMSTPQVMALATALGSMGIKAEAGGGSMSKLIKEIQIAVSTGSDSLNDFAQTAGMNAEEFAQAWEEDAGQAFARFLEGIGQSEDVTAKLAELGIEEIRMSNATGALAQSTDVYTSALERANSAWSSNTAMVEEAEKRYGTLKTSLSQAWEAIKQMGDELGQAFAPTMKTIAEGVKELARTFSELSPEAKQTVANLLALTAVASPAAKGVSILASGGQKTMKALFGVSDGASALASALGKGSKATEETTKYMSAYAKKTLEASSKTGDVTSSVAGLASAFGISLPAILGVVGALTAVAGAGAVVYVAGEKWRKSLEEQARSASVLNEIHADMLDYSKQYRQEAEQHAESAKSITREYESNAEMANRLAQRIEYLNGQENLNATQKDMLKNAVEQLNQIYPELNLSIDENTGKLQQNTEEMKANLEEAKRAAKEKALLEASQQQLEAITKQKMAYDQAKTSLKYWNDQVKTYTDEAIEAYAKGGIRCDEYKEAMHRLGEATAMQTQAQEELRQCLADGAISWEDYFSTINQMGGETSTLNQTLIEEFKSMVNEASEAGIQIPEQIRTGIESGAMNPVEAINFMSAMMSYQDMIATAGEGGSDIPLELANGIIANAGSAQEAANALQRLIEFQQAITDANASGKEIASELAVGVANGSVDATEAAQAINRGLEGQFRLLDTKGIGYEKGTEVGQGLEAGSANAPNSLAKLSHELKGAIINWDLAGTTKSEGTKASEALNTSLNPSVPNSAKSAIQGASSAFSGSGFASTVASVAGNAASSFASAISKVPSAARSAYNETKSIIDQIQQLTSRTYTVNVTKNIKTVETKETKPSRIAPRQLTTLSSVSALSDAEPQAVGIDRSAMLYASNAVSPVAGAVQEALNLASSNLGYSNFSMLNALASKLDALINLSSTETMEGYLKTIADNSVKTIVMDKREVGRVLVSPINEYNTMDNKFKQKMRGER